jgi:hypothetical protein
MRMADEMDNLLRDLGQGSPFPVDWATYERQLMERVFRRQAARARKMWLATLVGAVAGAAATFLITVSLQKSAPETEAASTSAPEQPAVEKREAPQPAAPVRTPVNAPVAEPDNNSGEFVLIVGRDGGIARLKVKEPSGDMQPFSKKVRRSDGRMSEITFAGYSGPDAGEPSYIAAKTKPALKRQGP